MGTGCRLESSTVPQVAIHNSDCVIWLQRVTCNQDYTGIVDIIMKPSRLDNMRMLCIHARDLTLRFSLKTCCYNVVCGSTPTNWSCTFCVFWQFGSEIVKLPNSTPRFKFRTPPKTTTNTDFLLFICPTHPKSNDIADILEQDVVIQCKHPGIYHHILALCDSSNTAMPTHHKQLSFG